MADTMENAIDKLSGVRMDKYRVQRIGGMPGKHGDCAYFVLDLQHDFFAGPALMAYADACDEEFPLLAVDLRVVAKDIIQRAALAREETPHE